MNETLHCQNSSKRLLQVMMPNEIVVFLSDTIVLGVKILENYAAALQN